MRHTSLALVAALIVSFAAAPVHGRTRPTTSAADPRTAERRGCHLGRACRGSSVGFSGDDRIVVDGLLGLDADLTFELWIKPGDRSVRRNPLTKAYAGEGNITQEVDGRLTFHHGDGGGNNPRYDFLRSSPLKPGAWSHVVVTRRGRLVSWYLNGKPDTQKTFGRPSSLSPLPLIIGDGYTHGYDGLIDEVAVYDRALAVEEIVDHYEHIGEPAAYTRLVVGDDPVGYWRLDEGGGVAATDAAGGRPGEYRGSPTYHQPGAWIPRMESITVRIDGAYFDTFSRHDRVSIDPEPGLVVAQSRVALSVLVSGNEDPVGCELSGLPMLREADDRFRIEIEPAYFVEELTLACDWDDGQTDRLTVEVVADDPELRAYFLRRGFPGFSYPGDPYSGWRQVSYYATIYRFIEYGEVYRHPGLYGVDENGELYRDVEQFLINGAEAFFEPCVDYDVFTAEESRQCRSTERVDRYYRWRSPNTAEVRTVHAKAEIRAAAGVAQAVKAILLRHRDAPEELCATSDNPSEIRDSSLTCRALNVRRLLMDEIWTKWTDDIWLDTLAVSPNAAIRTTSVPHYVAWAELILDLFRETADIEHVTVTGSEALIVPESRLDFLLGFFFTDEDGYTGMRCSHPDMPRACRWEDYDLARAGGVEIGHQDLTVHLLTQSQGRIACPTTGGPCIDMAELARTLKDKAWASQAPFLTAGVGFPKFDIFLDGHCRAHSTNPVDPLYGLCRSTWARDESAWKPHRALAGWVNLGVYDRELMILLRRAVDENHDGRLDERDARLRNFATFLMRAMAVGGRSDTLSD